MAIKPRIKNKSPPTFSHEFVIQNHADIVSCMAMLFVLGLMIQVTSAVCSPFVAIQHIIENAGSYVTLYTYGWKDICTIFFYMLICIVLHAVIQEYLLDRISKKLHLSKARNSQFNESGQLLAFYLISFLWSADIIIKGDFLSFSTLWTGYPHPMPFSVKFFLIVQLSYWLHSFPELYFQKVKKDEIVDKIKQPLIYLAVLIPAYLLNLNRITVFLLFFHSLSIGAFHATRLVEILDKDEKLSTVVCSAANIIFLISQTCSILLSLVTFTIGFSLVSSEQLDVSAGDFNIWPIRILMTAAVLSIEGYLTYIFGKDHIHQLKELQATLPAVLKVTSLVQKTKTSEKKSAKDKKKQRPKKKKPSSDNELPEADQHAKKSLKEKSVKAK